MRLRSLSIAVLGAALCTSVLPGCIHLPAKVAAVVNQSDPAPANNFRRDPAPHQAAANAKPAAP
ncbi:MAG: hypothetical protein ABI567_08575 [Gammaproteobacteria bacterium]